MQLSDYSTFICARINQSDWISVWLCKQFIQRRYQLIYEMRNWNDAKRNIAATLSDTTTGILAMPAGIDRIIAIRANGDHILTPADSPEVMQIDPTAFERSATPLVYEEFTSDAASPSAPGTVNIRFIPIPQLSTPLLITGRRTFVNLVNDTDTPILRNIDNPLIAFATADMLERAKQYTKAQAKIAEGTTLLDRMIKIETELSGSMPRIIPFVEPDGYCDGWGDYTFGIAGSPPIQPGSQGMPILFPLIQGQDYIDITFQPLSSPNWDFDGAVEYPTDPPPAKIDWVTVVAKTQGGARVYLNDAPPDGNYVLRGTIS